MTAPRPAARLVPAAAAPLGVGALLLIAWAPRGGRLALALVLLGLAVLLRTRRAADSGPARRVGVARLASLGALAGALAAVAALGAAVGWPAGDDLLELLDGLGLGSDDRAVALALLPLGFLAMAAAAARAPTGTGVTATVLLGLGGAVVLLVVGALGAGEDRGARPIALPLALLPLLLGGAPLALAAALERHRPPPAAVGRPGRARRR
ncbi:hypothetical protein SK069_16460 [Patulibacter brassicae]|uniref:Integral membrane protein n=1 Tax=Patulibacter brassicae TaxID=1705717 RepID=A0ABU4VMX3_9ACTN|nr:hypothetical protein [Patulibacter brassicae]MDX8153192.1 hypothetical protein [Patulibacter brassicae]